MNTSITKESNENILNTSSVMRQLDCGEVTIRFAEKFIFLWDEQGTGSGTKHISLCQPLPDNCDNEEGFFSLGSVAVHAWKISDCVSHGVSGILIKQNYIPDGKMPALAHPVDFEERWNSVNSGAIICGSIWRPVPPEGYVALGDVANNRYGSRSKPDVKQVVCVRSDLAVEGTLEGDTFIWNDATSGGTHDVSLWEIKPKSAFSVENCSIFVASGGFIATDVYDKPSKQFRDPSLHVLKLPIVTVDGGEITRPKITGYDSQIDLKHIVKRSFYVPCTALAEDKDMKREDQFRTSPFYRLERHVRYNSAQGFYGNESSEPIKKTITIETGITKAKSETISAGASLTIGAEAGCKFIGGSVSAELSASFGWDTTNTTEIFTSKSTSTEYTIPAWSAMGIYQMDEIIYVKRGDGSDFEGNTLAFLNDSATRTFLWEDPEHKEPSGNGNFNELQPWLESSKYKAGDLVIYEGEIFEVTSDAKGEKPEASDIFTAFLK